MAVSGWRSWNAAGREIDGEKRGEQTETERERERGKKKMARARLDTLDVGGRSVVRHITPLIQRISGREQLARKSQLPRFQPPLQLGPFSPGRRVCTYTFVFINICQCRSRYKCHYFRITGAESYSSVNREPFSHPISSPDRWPHSRLSRFGTRWTLFRWARPIAHVTEQMTYRYFHFSPLTT